MTLAWRRRSIRISASRSRGIDRLGRRRLIRKIEADDFSECGGDFYTRGHIRAIAKAVGTDPEPLIEDYDTDHRATGPMATVSLDELLATSAPQRHRPDLPAAWARVTAASAPVARKASAGAGAVRGRMASGRRPGRRTARWAVFVCLALVVVALGFAALHVLAGAPAAAPSAAGKHAATGHNDGHGQPGPAAKASHRAAPSPAPKASHTAAPSPAQSQPAQSLAPVQATAFGPNGGDNPQLAHLVLGGGHSAGWHTDWYNSARFGNLYPGTGLLLKMGRTVTITGAQDRPRQRHRCQLPVARRQHAHHGRAAAGSARVRCERDGAAQPRRARPAAATCSSGSPGCPPTRPAPSRPASTTWHCRATG